MNFPLLHTIPFTVYVDKNDACIFDITFKRSNHCSVYLQNYGTGEGVPHEIRENGEL